MAHMNKQQVQEVADRLGIDISGMSWPDMQKAVKAAQLEEQVLGFKKELQKNSAESKPVSVAVPAKAVRKDRKRNPLDQFRTKEILISPEIRPNDDAGRFKYDEVLGDDLEVEEAYYDGTTLDSRNTNSANGTYVVRGKSGKKVIAQSTIPKRNARISFRPGVDMFPVCTYLGKSGYLLTHATLPNVKATLRQSGYWEEYKERFKEEPARWYAASKQLCCDIGLTHAVMREIEEKERERRRRG